jgi:GDPmannose 4,6-dehydratase
LLSNKNLILKYYDLTDSCNIVNIINEIKNSYKNIKVLEIYNLAAMSHVKVSFEMPEYTANVDGLGVLRILEAIKNSGISNKIKFYQASTSELYGLVQEIPQTENTIFYPRSPYGVAKLYGYWITKNYRESYELFCSNGILFNHESPRRGPTFVTRKITIGLNKILTGKDDKLILGNLDAKRDWGHAKDYVEGMWKILQYEKPDDFILSTNQFHSVREFVEEAFKLKGFNIKWKGTGLNEIGYDENTGKELIFVSEKYFRPAEVEQLLGDSTKAKKKLNWTPNYNFYSLVKEMVENDCTN